MDQYLAKRFPDQSVRLDAPQVEAVEAAVGVTLQGGVVLAPTDTVYGLHCHPFQPSALERILAIKRRREEKGFLLLVPEPGWAEELCPRVPPFFERLAAMVWPGPVTILLEGHPSLSPLILGSEGKVGIRMPDVKFLQEWMRGISAPIVSSSANRSGDPSPATLVGLRELFEQEVDLILDNGDPATGLASSVVDLTVTPPRLARRGAGIEKLNQALAALGAS